MAFSSPNFNGPLDTNARIAAIPPNEEAKGIMFIVAQEYYAKQTGKQIGKAKYSPLASYPVTELIQLLDEIATSISPTRPKEVLYKIGLELMPKLKTIAAGSFLFSSVGTDVSKGFAIADRFYHTLSNVADIKVVEVDANHGVIATKKMWIFPQCFQVGIFESYVKLFGKVPTTTIQDNGMFDVDFHCKW